jgi:uncharacterized repeat protein (TIGR01451 family)
MAFLHDFARRAYRLQRIGVFAAGALIALASSGLSAATIIDKDASYGEMLELATQMKSLKPKIRTDAAASNTYTDALARYREISSSMGGDDPAHIGGGSGSHPSRGPTKARVATAAPTACGGATTTFTQSTPLAVADLAVSTSTIVVAGANPYLYDLNVQTFLRHTFPADLDVTITSPAGTVVTLTTDNGGTNDDVFNGTIWDDSADPGGQVPYTSDDGLVTDRTYAIGVVAPTLVPEEALGAFIGEDPNGTWTITISDDLAGDTGTLDSWSLILTALPNAPAITTVPTVTNSTPVAIPTGPAVVTSTIVVSGAGTSLIDVNATTFIQHTFSADLDVTITSPAGTVVTLTTDNGGSNDDVFNGTVWDDSANPGGQVPYTTNDGLVTDHAYVNLALASPLVPEEAMAAFVGEDPNGTWTLTISDDLAGDGGSLNSWSLDIKTFTCTSADLSITKTDGVASAAPGGSVTYTITGSNAGPDPVADAAIVDTFAADLTCTWTCTGVSGGTCTASGSGNINEVANLPSGGSVSYTASCTISTSATGTLTNSASIASATVPDPDTGNNSAADTDMLAAQADLSINKTDSVSTATPGGSTTYTITALNAGPSNANGATVTDTFPPSETCTWTCTGTGGGTCTASGSGNINDAINLPSGGGAIYTASCTISASATGSLTNMASIAPPAGVTDANSGNDTSTDIDALGALADLAIDKTDGVSTATAGGSTTYTITASNAGPSNANGAIITDTFPPSETCTWTCTGTGSGTCTASGSGNVNDVINLPVGGGAIYVASCTISASATGSLTNMASIAPPAGVTDVNSGNNTSTDIDALGASADLAITNTDGVASVTAGGNVVYTIAASNAGPSSVTGATVADTFPVGETCSWTCAGSGGTCAASGSGNINDLINLPAGATVTYTASCAVSFTASSPLSNTATVTAPLSVTDTTPVNNTATDTDTVTAAPAAAISGIKTVSPSGSALPRGSNVTYTIVLTNSGVGAQGDNPGDEFIDTLPTGVTYSSSTATSGNTTFSAGAVRWNGTLASGASVTITIVATISTTASGTISNQGTISYDSNGDGTNDATALTDDPTIGGATDPTTFAVAVPAPPVATTPVPTMTAWGLLLLVFGFVTAAFLRRRSAR